MLQADRVIQDTVVLLRAKGWLSLDRGRGTEFDLLSDRRAVDQLAVTGGMVDLLVCPASPVLVGLWERGCCSGEGFFPRRPGLCRRRASIGL